MAQAQTPIFESERLRVRTATDEDVDLFYALWTDPEVMKHVGFPRGLPITRDEIKARLVEQGETAFAQLLVIELKETAQAIGECKLSSPNPEGMVEPDIKLLPACWGKGYGRESWSDIVSYHFKHTNCEGIQTTPNVENTTAIKIYESTGAVREGENIYYFPESMQDYTTPVHHFIYRLYRKDWERK
jgi:RimJ/RimL family protein N-acetyltransferase